MPAHYSCAPDSAGVAELRHFDPSGFLVKPETGQKTQKLKTSIKLITAGISVPISRKTCGQPRIFKRFEKSVSVPVSFGESLSYFETTFCRVNEKHKSLQIFKIHHGEHAVSAVCLTGITLGSKAGKSLTHGFKPKLISWQAEVPHARCFGRSQHRPPSAMLLRAVFCRAAGVNCPSHPENMLYETRFLKSFGNSHLYSDTLW